MTNAPILTHLRNQTQLTLTSLPGDERDGGTHKRKASAATCAAAVNADSWMDDDDDDQQQQQQQQQQHNVASAPANRPVKQKHGAFDVVLSSGFLAFANHAGFLQAVEDAGLDVRGVMGTSAGALSGSLYAAGYAPHEVAAELSRVAPIQLLGPGVSWKGALSMSRVVERLRVVLPATFEELPVEFACGVVDASGRHRLIDSGPLPEAVAASAAIPVLFEPVYIPGQNGGPFADGGKADRVGLRQWRARRRLKKNAIPPAALVHLIERSSPFSGADDVSRMGESNVTLVTCAKSGQYLWSLGEFDEQMERSRANAAPALEVHKARVPSV